MSSSLELTIIVIALIIYCVVCINIMILAIKIVNRVFDIITGTLKPKTRQ